MVMPAARWSQSSQAQPNSCARGAQNRAASATRPVTTTWAPLIERVHDGAGAEVGVGEERVRRQAECVGVGAHVVAHDRGDPEARRPRLRRSLTHGPAGGQWVDTSGVGDEAGSALHDLGSTSSRYSGRSRVTHGLVPGPVLLEDGQVSSARASQTT